MTEHKVYLEIQKSYSDKRIIEGYATTEGVDLENDKFILDGLKKSIDEYMANPVVRWQHKEEYVIGKTIDVSFDDKGMLVKIQLVKGVPKAEEVWNLIEQGVIKHLSVGYIVPLDSIDYDYDTGVKIIKSAKIKEISIVDVPANPEAKILNVVKSLKEEIDKKWDAPDTKKERQELLDKCGESAFLLPEELKFPVKNPDCSYNLDAIRNAIARASQFGYADVEQKARQLLEKLKNKEGGKMGDVEENKKVEEIQTPESEEPQENEQNDSVEVNKGKFLDRVDGKLVRKDEKQNEEEPVEEKPKKKVKKNKSLDEVDIVKKLEEIIEKKLEILKKSEVEVQQDNHEKVEKSAGELLKELIGD